MITEDLCNLPPETTQFKNLNNHYSLLVQALDLRPIETPCAFTTQKMKFSIRDFFSKCDQIRRKLRIW